MIFKSEVAARLVAVLLLVASRLCGAAEPGQDAADQQSGPAIQHELVTELQVNPVEYRHFIKESMEGHLGAFGLILMMRAPDTEDLPLHAEALVWLTRLHGTLYPPGSETAGTRDVVWQEPEPFAAAAAKTAELAAALKAAVDGGNRHQVLNALVMLGESCESCHARFRNGE